MNCRKVKVPLINDCRVRYDEEVDTYYCMIGDYEVDYTFDENNMFVIKSVFYWGEDIEEVEATNTDEIKEYIIK